jgi:uncharacterized protein DUF1844
VSQPELTPEQLIEQIKQLKVSDLVISTVTTLGQLGYAKLEEGTRDLEQARLAIDSLQALIPKLEGHVAAEITRDLNAMVANLQLAYASAAKTSVDPAESSQ